MRWMNVCNILIYVRITRLYLGLIWSGYEASQPSVCMRLWLITPVGVKIPQISARRSVVRHYATSVIVVIYTGDRSQSCVQTFHTGNHCMSVKWSNDIKVSVILFMAPTDLIEMWEFSSVFCLLSPSLPVCLLYNIELSFTIHTDSSLYADYIT